MPDAVALAAIASSFFGHYLGAAEGAAGIVRSMVDSDGSRISDRALHIGIAALDLLRGQLNSLHSRKLRSFDEPPFR